MAGKKNIIKKAPRFSVPLYGQLIVLLETPEDFEAWRAHLENDEPQIAERGCAGLCCPYRNREGHTVYLVGVFDRQLATLAHELAHCTFFLLSEVGIPVVDGASNEAYCYLFDALLTEALPLIELD